MRSIPVSELVPATVEVIGALDFDRSPQGLSPRRLPAYCRNQLTVETDAVARMPSGVRMRFRTDSGRLGLHFRALRVVTPGSPLRPVTLTLEVGGELQTASSTAGSVIHVDPRKPGDVRMEPGGADTVTFEAVPKGAECELWLPHNAMIELRALLVEEGAQVAAAVPDPRPRWMHYGSSISHCMEALQPAHVWPAVAARRAGLCLHSLGLAGQCHLDQFVARTMRDSDASFITIKTGINVVNMDSMRERTFVSALHGFLDTLREGKPETPVVLISPIYCPSAEDHPGPTRPNSQGKYVTIAGNEEIREGCLTLTRIRQLMSELVETRRAAGDAALRYHDGLQLFGQADAGDLPDDLHPSAEGYVRIGERFAAQVLSPLMATRGGA